MLNQNIPPHMQLAIMSRGYVLSRAIHTIANLNIADHMSEKPLSALTIAKATETDPELLERLLKFLCNYGLFTQTEHGYALTDLSKPLQENDSHSIKDVINMVDDSWWQAFTYLNEGLKTGKPPFEIQHEADFFSFLSNNPQKQANFDKGMAKLSTYDDDAIAKVCHLDQIQTLIDLGGGRGGLSKAIATRFPKLQVTLFDSSSVINPLNPQNFPSNMHLAIGDFFAEIPKADAYIFKGVLHDFNDQMVNTILINLHTHMPDKASLFIAEQVIPENEGPHPNKTMDIVMMVLLGGRQRTLEDWKKMIEPLGFEFRSSNPTETIFTVIEFGKVCKSV